MSDLRITQMPAGVTLTGLEQMELVQNGLNVQTTVAGLAQAASMYSILGSPNVPINGSLANQYSYMFGISAPSGGGTHEGGGNMTNSFFSGWQWLRLNSNYSVYAANASASTVGGSVMEGTYNTSAVQNTPGGITCNTGISSLVQPVSTAFIRAASNGLPIAGFTMSVYMTFTGWPTGASFFFGFTGNTNGSLGSITPSALINSIGFGQDTGDTDLQFMINNGSGTATKTDLGITGAGVLNHLLRMVITCDGFGNCALSVLDLDTGILYSVTYSFGTAKLPAANTLLIPQWWLNNPANTSVGTIGIGWLYLTNGFGG